MIGLDRRVTRVGAAVALSLTLAACGNDDSDNGDATVVSTATVAADGTTTPAPPGEPTATPEAANTPAPSATTPPEPSPTPATLSFTTADAGGGSNTPRSAGPLGIVYADSSFSTAPGSNRAFATAFVNIGIMERPSATAWIQNNFRVPGDGTAAVDAQISASVSWQGVLAGNGAGGTRAAVTITLSVVDGDRTIASETVHSEEQRESLLTVGGFDDVGTANADLQVALVPGVYSLRLSVTCEAGSGLIGAATHCIFGPSDTYDDGFVEWDERTILFSP